MLVTNMKGERVKVVVGRASEVSVWILHFARRTFALAAFASCESFVCVCVRVELYVLVVGWGASTRFMEGANYMHTTPTPVNAQRHVLETPSVRDTHNQRGGTSIVRPPPCANSLW